MRYFLVFCLLYGLLPPVPRARAGAPPDSCAPVAVRGTIDLRGCAFSDGLIPLLGEWDFFWQELLPPSDTARQATAQMAVPGYWAARGYSYRGYASYRLKLRLPPGQQALSLHVPEQATAYRLFVDGRLLAEVGEASSREQDARPGSRPLSVTFLPNASGTACIVFHISNYHHKKGGLWEPVSLGTPAAVSGHRSRQLLVALFLTGAISIIGLYHFVIFLLRPSDRQALYFSLLCLLTLSRLLAMNEMFVLELWPGIPWEWRVRMEVLPFYGLIVMGMLFTRSLFPDEYHPWAVKAVVGLGGLGMAACLLLPARLHSHAVVYYEGWILLALVYMLARQGLAVWRGREGAWAYALGFLCIFGTTLNDILHSEKVWNTAYLTPLGVFLFFFAQAVVLAIRYAGSYRHAQQYASQLRQLNEGLEAEVEKRLFQLDQHRHQLQLRTHDLQLSEHEALLKAEELANTLERLKNAEIMLAQSEKMAALGQLTAGIAHEINNPLNFLFLGIDALKGLCADLALVAAQYDRVLEAPESERPAQLEALQALKQSVHYGELAADLEQLLADLKSGAQRTAEIVKGLRTFSRLDASEALETDLHLCIDSTLVILKSEYKDRVDIVKEYDPELPLVNCLAGQINQVLMNVLSNGLQAIEGKGTIRIATRRLPGQEVEIRISDSGKGMPESVKARIFDPFFTTKKAGVGTGLGLSISRDIVQRHRGRISVESHLGKGTVFSIVLPVDMREAPAES